MRRAVLLTTSLAIVVLVAPWLPAAAAEPAAIAPGNAAPGSAAPGSVAPGSAAPAAGIVEPELGVPPAARVLGPGGAPAAAPAGAPAEKDIMPMRPSRGSGFWTSSRPARGGAYRYRLLLIGVTVSSLMLGIMIWLVRRTPPRAS